MRTIQHLLILMISLTFAPISGLEACSVCRCGDNAFLFSQRGFEMPGQSMESRFSLSLGNLYSNKSNILSGDEGVGTEHQREIRPSLRMSYNITHNFSFAFELPFQFRKIVVTTADGIGNERSSGIGDAEISTVWMRELSESNGRFYIGGLSLSAKVSTGRNNLLESGARLDEHLQAGSGSYDWQLGGALSRSTCASELFASLYYRTNGTNDYRYHYGDAALYNLGGQWPLTDWLTSSVQINGRYASRDSDHNDVVANTGGWVTYLSPGFKVSLSRLSGVYAAVQIPIYQKLFGVQTEKAVLSTGISFQL
ncbi:MAG TPA: hypothetical protein DEO84_07015 [candidate division Zixibacteria bacterium]|nr:hypothetical protein [candidate division Zixibacteria bacterium]